MHLIARQFELVSLRLGRCPRREQRALRVFVVELAHRAVELQPLHALPVRLGLLRSRTRRCQLLARGFFRESIVGVVEHGEHLALAHALADVDPTLEDLAADAECLIHFVPCLHGAEVATHVARTLVPKLDYREPAEASPPAACRVRTPKAMKQWLRRWSPCRWKLSRLILVGGRLRVGRERLRRVG